MLLTERCHKLCKFLDSCEGHGIVDGGAHAADTAVSLDAAEAELLCLCDKVVVQGFAREAACPR